MIRHLLRGLLGYDQPLLQYCTRCASHWPPDHFPCR